MLMYFFSDRNMVTTCITLNASDGYFMSYYEYHFILIMKITRKPLICRILIRVDEFIFFF